MDRPSTCSHWYRVAGLHPRLRTHVRIQRQIYGDQTWYLLADGLRGRTHRVNGFAYNFIGRADGELSVQEIWDCLLDANPEEAPTQNDIVELLVGLNQRGLLQCELTRMSNKFSAVKFRNGSKIAFRR